MCGVCWVGVWFSGWKLLGGLDHGDDSLHELSVGWVLLVVDEVLADVGKADVDPNLDVVGLIGAAVLALNRGHLGVRNKGGDEGGVGLDAGMLGVRLVYLRALLGKLSGGQRGRRVDVAREMMVKACGDVLDEALGGGLRVDWAAVVTPDAAAGVLAGALAIRSLTIPRALGVGVGEDVVNAVADAVDDAVAASAGAGNGHDDVAGLVISAERVLGHFNHAINPMELARGDIVLSGKVSDVGLGGGNLGLVGVDVLVAAFSEDHADRGLLVRAAVAGVGMLGDLDGGLIAGLGEFVGGGADDGLVALGGDVVLFDGVAHVCYWVRRSLSLCVHLRATSI